MRLFEGLTILLLLIIVIYNMRPHKKPTSTIQLFYLVPLVAHLFIEGFRWQLIGIYGLSVFYLILLSHRMLKSRRPRSIKRMNKGDIVALFIIAISVILLFLFPVKHMAAPIGPYPVGTISYDLTDTSRTELYGNHKGDFRKIRIQLWYPTNEDYEGEKALWLEDGNIVPRGLMASYGAPAFVYDHLSLIKSNSFSNAPLNTSVGELPVVIISHGWTGFRNLHTDLGETFASLGYLAISIDHTYGSVGLAFDDGESVLADFNALPNRDENDDFILYANKLVDTYSKDTGFVIDHLEAIASGAYPSSFVNHLDLDQIGVIGHSTGGGGVVKQSIIDPRIKAIIGLDPWVEPIGESLLLEGFTQPALFFRSTSWAGGINDDFIKLLTTNPSNDLQIYEISGSSHQDFTMLYQMGPIPTLMGIRGELDGRESASIQQDIIVAFMNQHLLNMNTNLASLIEQYDVVSEVIHQ